jgi:CTP synthase
MKHAGAALDCKVKLSYLDSEVYEKDVSKLEELRQYDGVLVPGGFGSRGVEGIIAAIRFAREERIPYFGLCYGMQLLVIEYARNKAGLAGATTAEINKEAAHPVIDIMPDQKDKMLKDDYGGTMRLGTYPCTLREGTVAYEAYGTAEVSERHRHRYEVNPQYVTQLTEAGLVFSGVSPDRSLMEIAELPREEHPFFLGSQFHPEFLSRPLTPHPLFVAFVQAASASKA